MEECEERNCGHGCREAESVAHERFICLLGLKNFCEFVCFVFVETNVDELEKLNYTNNVDWKN